MIAPSFPAASRVSEASDAEVKGKMRSTLTISCSASAAVVTKPVKRDTIGNVYAKANPVSTMLRSPAKRGLSLSTYLRNGNASITGQIIYQRILVLV
jgi:hypothetical protein